MSDFDWDNDGEFDVQNAVCRITVQRTCDGDIVLTEYDENKYDGHDFRSIIIARGNARAVAQAILSAAGQAEDLGEIQSKPMTAAERQKRRRDKQRDSRDIERAKQRDSRDIERDKRDSNRDTAEVMWSPKEVTDA